MKRTFMGYERPDGSVGIRNYIAVLSTVSCANAVVQHIADGVAGTIPLCHGHGCGRRLEKTMHTNTMVGLGCNPNVFAVLVVSLGCEGTPAAEVAERIRSTGKMVELLVIQDAGSKKTIKKGIEIIKKFNAEAEKQERKEFPASKLMIGLECGGSDALSGVTANPAIGRLSDWLVGQGGTSVLTEITELIGTTSILVRRCATPEVAQDVTKIIGDMQKNLHDVLGENAARAIAPGNMDGGMSTIQEKALGCVRKGGTSVINEVVEYGEKPSKSGLIIMNGPGYDAESLTGLAAMGCQIIFFSTGRGNPLGYPIVPVVKVSSNSELFMRMQDDIDINAGRLLDEDYSMDDIEEDMADMLLCVAEGKETKAEKNGQGGYICLWSWSKAH